MISHALTIVMNELNKHMAEVYNATDAVALGDEIDLPRGKLCLSAVNVRGEKAPKHTCYVPSRVNPKARYRNRPELQDVLVLVTATHADYTLALSVLSRVIRFFQFKDVLTHENVDPSSLTTAAVPINPLDQLQEFKLVFDIYSPSQEKANHLWGNLGGKKHPSVLYVMRMRDLKFRSVEKENPLVIEMHHDIHHKQTAGARPFQHVAGLSVSCG